MDCQKLSFQIIARNIGKESDNQNDQDPKKHFIFPFRLLISERPQVVISGNPFQMSVLFEIRKNLKVLQKHIYFLVTAHYFEPLFFFSKNYVTRIGHFTIQQRNG